LKKIASILLLAMLLFNWCGYRWVLNYMQQKADVTLEAKLDNNDYDESQLIEIKIPINMPYQTSWADFERYDGAVEVNGIHYKYVKRKIENGQLVLKCIPNEAKQRLQNAGDNFFKLVNDLQQDHSAKKSNSTTIIKSTLSDYDKQQPLNVVAASMLIVQPGYTMYQSSVVNSHFHLSPEQPPEA
jgi:hypothetical protein